MSIALKNFLDARLRFDMPDSLNIALVLLHQPSCQSYVPPPQDDQGMDDEISNGSTPVRRLLPATLVYSTLLETPRMSFETGP